MMQRPKHSHNDRL